MDLYNRTPRQSNVWKPPYELFFTETARARNIEATPRKPNDSYLKTYGCKAFALTSDTLQGKSKLQRLDARAWIGYLVGYNLSNIYKTWVPITGKTINTRDIVFDGSTVFSGEKDEVLNDLMHTTTQETAEWTDMIELPERLTNARNETYCFFEDNTLGRDPDQEDGGVAENLSPREVSTPVASPASQMGSVAKNPSLLE